MKGHRSKLFVHASAALLAVAILAGPASAQSGLETRLDEAGQKLDSDMQSCRPVNLAEYAILLNEAMTNKQRAAKAAKKGIPVNQAQVDSDLAKASMLFARAQAAQAMQCMRAAQQQAQPQPQAKTAPQSTGMAPSNASVTPPQGLSPTDQVAIARQQLTIDQFESDLAELESLVKAGKCREAWDLVDDLDDWLDELDTPVRAASLTSAAYRPSVPGRLIDEWDDRIDELIKNCPRAGMLDYKQVRTILDVHNAERAQYGLQPLRWSFKAEGHAFAYVGELKQTGKMVHASREGRGTERENISQGLPWWSIQQHLESWTKEKKKFKPGIFPDVSFTGNWYEVGHWTQMIWARTAAIGCAMAIGGPASWLVCRYNPGGNRDGQPVGIPPLKVAEVEQPLPRTEVFKQPAKPAPTMASSNGDMTVRTAPSFDIGVYAGAAWTTDWFRIGDESDGIFGEWIGDTASAHGLFPTVLAARTWNSLCTQELGAGGSVDPLSIDQSLGLHLSVPLSNTGALNLAYMWLDSDQPLAVISGGGVASKVNVYGGDLKFNFSNLDIEKGFDSTSTLDVETNALPPDPAAPKLPAKEVYNPADRPQCVLDIM